MNSIGEASLRSPESSPRGQGGGGGGGDDTTVNGYSGRNSDGDVEVSFADPDTIFSADDAKLVPLMRMQADLKGRLVAALAEASDERGRNQRL